MQPIFTDFKPPSPPIAHDIHAREGEERGKRKEKRKALQYEVYLPAPYCSD